MSAPAVRPGWTGPVSRRRIWQRSWPFHTYLGLVVLVFAIATALVSWNLRTETRGDAEDAARADASFAANKGATDLNDSVKLVQTTLLGTAASPAIAKIFDQPQSCTLRFTSVGVFEGYGAILTPDGATVCASQTASGVVDLSGSEWLPQAQNGPLFIPYQINPADGKPFAIGAAPIADRGVLVFVVRLQPVGQLLASRYGGSRQLEFVVTAANAKTMLARSIDPERWSGTSLDATRFGQAGDATERPDVDGTGRLYGSSPVSETGWQVYAGANRADALAASNRLFKRQLAMVCAGFLAVLAAAIFGYFCSFRPIRKLARALKNALDGPFEPVSVGGPAEVVALTREFNQLNASFHAQLTGATELATALRDAGSRARAVLNTAVDGIITIGPDGTVESFNPAAERLFGYGADEVIGNNVMMLMPPPYADGHDGYLRNYLETGVAKVIGIGREVAGLRKDGSSFPLELSVGETQVNGRLLFTGVIHDLTERRSSEEQRERAVALESASRAKTEFLSRMSHELRTPMNVILGFGQVLQLDEMSTEQTDAVDHILKAGRHLLALIDEVLDVSRIESGKLQLSIEPLPVKQLFDECSQLMAPLGRQRGIELVTRCSDGHHILGDRQRVEQVILNLLSNGIKYNRHGGNLSLTCGEANPEGFIRISVTDTGPGISPEVIERVFVPFDRLGAETSLIEGTGLGLALSRDLVHAMNGSISVESTLGLGSTFAVDLPIAEAPSLRTRNAIAAIEPQRNATSAKVLYVEDNLANFEVMRAVVSRLTNYELISAMQGSIGLELAKEHHPDLILLDVQLPDIDGGEVLRRLKTDAATAAIPVIIVSANISKNDRERYARDGARASITKPFDVRALLAAFDEALAA